MAVALDHYIEGQWRPGIGEVAVQYHALTGTVIAFATRAPSDGAAILDFARRKGGPALRRLTFHERGRMLKALGKYLLERKEKYYTLAARMGATQYDAWLDIEGGLGCLFAYGALRHDLPDQTFWTEDESVALVRDGGFSGRHIWVPRPGAALHIHPFCNPVRHFLEKLAISVMAGMPSVAKASEQTSFMTEAVMRDIVESNLLPVGALQLITGTARDLVESLTAQDVATFTGRASTGQILQESLRLPQGQIPFYLHTESANIAVLGEDAGPGTLEFDLFISECRREIVIQAGQRCTAFRRMAVPEKYAEAVKAALIKDFSRLVVGDPARPGVHMGPLANRWQVARVVEQVGRLTEYASLVFGDPSKFDIDAADATQGAFLPPMLYWAPEPLRHPALHTLECFGPVATLMPYRHLEEAIELARLGGHSLVGMFCSNDRHLQEEYTFQTAAFHGRTVLLNRESTKNNPGSGVQFPMLHQSPGNTGGLTGLQPYWQRSAIQGHPNNLTSLLRQQQPGAERPETAVHPFQKNFAALTIGETWVTARHTINVTDLHRYASISGDYFFANMDESQLKETPYRHRTVHPFFVLTRAVGLFTDAKKGAMLLTFGLDSCRFIKPAYPGTTIGAKLTVQEKIPVEAPNQHYAAAGTVKWQVEVFDEKNEMLMTATLLTLFK